MNDDILKRRTTFGKNIHRTFGGPTMARWIGCCFMYVVAGIFATPLVCPFVGWAFWGIWLPISLIGGTATAVLSGADDEGKPWMRWVVLTLYGIPVGVIFYSLAGIIVLFIVHISAPVVLIGATGALIAFLKEMGHGQAYNRRKFKRELAAIEAGDAHVIAHVIARNAAARTGHGHH